MEHPEIVKAKKMGCSFRTEADEASYLKAKKRRDILLVGLTVIICVLYLVAGFAIGYKQATIDTWNIVFRIAALKG